VFDDNNYFSHDSRLTISVYRAMGAGPPGSGEDAVDQLCSLTLFENLNIQRRHQRHSPHLASCLLRSGVKFSAIYGNSDTVRLAHEVGTLGPRQMSWRGYNGDPVLVCGAPGRPGGTGEPVREACTFCLFRKCVP
jgi:hypothetical protein